MDFDVDSYTCDPCKDYWKADDDEEDDIEELLEEYAILYVED